MRVCPIACLSKPRSPARSQSTFAQVEGNWADWMLAKAASAETPAGQRRATLDKVARTTTVDGDRRRKAADLLEEIDKGREIATPTSPVTSVSLAVPPASATPSTAATASAAAPRASTTRPPVTAPAGSSGKTPALSPLEQAKAALLREDYGTARLLLYDRLRNGGTEAELRVLREACKGIRDTACVEECKRRLGS